MPKAILMETYYHVACVPDSDDETSVVVDAPDDEICVACGRSLSTTSPSEDESDEVDETSEEVIDEGGES